jgi:hypothetical protein
MHVFPFLIQQLNYTKSLNRVAVLTPKRVAKDSFRFLLQRIYKMANFGNRKVLQVMAKNILLFSILFFIGACFFFSCSKAEIDNEPPSMQLVSIKPGDVVYTDSAYSFEAMFADDKGLSSYSIQIRHTRFNLDSITVGQLDVEEVAGKKDTAALFYKNFQSFNIFDTTEYHVNIRNAFKIDTAKVVGNKPYPIRLGEHYFKITLVDMGGQSVVDSFLIDVRSKKELSGL